MGNSVLIMGIDGASWDFLKPWINDGKLPTLKKLIDLGSSGDLRTVVPPLSSAAWISMVTGKNPGKHGIYGFLDENGQLLDSTSIKSERIWNILSERDKRCCVIGVPLTYPVDNINGCMISGVLTPPDKKDYFYPAELLPMLKKYDYQIIVEFEKNDPLMPDQQNVIERRDYFLKKIYYVMEKKYLAIKELMSDRWDFFMFVISETTHVKDLFWDKKDGGFFFSGEDNEKLIMNRKEIYDGAIPSGNSVAALNLLRLGRITANGPLEKKSEELMNAFSSLVADYPMGYSQLLIALDFAIGPSKEIVIAGESGNKDTMEMLKVIRSQFLPRKIVLLQSGKAIEKISPFVKDQRAIDGKATAYVCENYACKLPTTEIKELEKLLSISK